MVLRAGRNSDGQPHADLESLCRLYWFPLYTFARRQGRSHHEAEDCTQDFLARLLADRGLQRARPEHGRFRTFLLAALGNFLVSDWRRTQAAKRGSGQTPIRLGTPGEDIPFSEDIRDLALTPEQAFDRSWARALIDRAVHELRVDYEKSGRAEIFDKMAPLIWGAEHGDTFTRHATQLGLSVNSFTVALHRARRRLGERLRAIVAETVADPAEIDAELRHLVSAISGTTARD
jgi:RNA polymerase sigma-70 factor (ECF subfamily)